MKLSSIYRKTTRKPIKAYWWRYEYPHKLNFGDEITPLLIEKIFGFRCIWSEPKDCELIGAGSIIELASELSQGNRLKVWGSGFIKRPEGPVLTTEMEFSAVRGKLTAKRLGLKSPVLGDPGLLAPYVFSASKAKKYKLGIVPHYVDTKHPLVSRLEAQGAKVIDVLSSPQQVATDISSCELVFSSSLHGLIFSDAYKIPNYWLPLTDQLTGGDYKFRDYYSVFEQDPRPLTATTLQKTKIDDLIAQYSPKVGIEYLQSELIRHFPY